MIHIALFRIFTGDHDHPTQNLPFAFLPTFLSFKMPLSVIATVADFCEFTLALVNASRLYKPKELYHRVVVPMPYLRAIPQFTADTLGFQAATNAWWASYKEAHLDAPSSLKFDMCRFGLEITVSFAAPAPALVWTVGTSHALIKSLVRLHAEVAPTRSVTVAIPRDALGRVDVFELTLGMDMPVDAASIEITVTKDYVVLVADKL